MIMHANYAGEKFPPLAVELDTCMNKNQNDPDDNHIGIDIESTESDPAESLSNIGIDLKSGREIQVQIYYDALINVLSVSAAYLGEPLRKLIERRIVLSEIIPSSVYIGFTAATGDFAESHQLLKWTFSSFPLVASYLKKENLKMPL